MLSLIHIYVVKLFLNGEKEFEIYLAKAVLIALSFIIAELLHSLSTALSLSLIHI